MDTIHTSRSLGRALRRLSGRTPLLQSDQYTYDPNSNLLSEERPDRATTYFDYDALNRQTQIHYPNDGTIYYGYNAYSQLMQVGDERGTINLAWDPKFLITEDQPDGTSLAYFYDFADNLSWIQDSDGYRSLAWEKNGLNIFLEKDESDTVLTEYVHGYTPIAGIGSMTMARHTTADALTTYYQFPIYDHRGTVMRIVDETGQITHSYEYNAWGQPLEAVESPGMPPNRFGYQSNYIELKDSGRTLLISPTRIYDGISGRFLQPDPWPLLVQRNQLGASTESPFGGLSRSQTAAVEAMATFSPPTAPRGQDPEIHQFDEIDGFIDVNSPYAAYPVNQVDPTGMRRTALCDPCPPNFQFISHFLFPIAVQIAVFGGLLAFIRGLTLYTVMVEALISLKFGLPIAAVIAKLGEVCRNKFESREGCEGCCRAQYAISLAITAILGLTGFYACYRKGLQRGLAYALTCLAVMKALKAFGFTTGHIAHERCIEDCCPRLIPVRPPVPPIIIPIPVDWPPPPPPGHITV